MRLAALATLLAATLALAGCGGNTPSGKSIATKIGADYCNPSGYDLKDSLNGSTQTIYDCSTGPRRQCVTLESGIALDQTATVRALFANALSQDRPLCIA